MRYFSCDVEGSESIYASGDDSLSPASRNKPVTKQHCFKKFPDCINGLGGEFPAFLSVQLVLKIEILSTGAARLSTYLPHVDQQPGVERVLIGAQPKLGVVIG